MATTSHPVSGSPPIAADQALISLRRILKAVDAQARTLARDTSLTPSQIVVLKELAARESVQPGELARSAGLKQATISILLDRLQERGLVQRTRGDEDRRTVRVQITPDGRQVLSEAPDLLQTQFGGRFESLPEWEQAYINAALTRLVALLGATDIDASPVLDVGGLTDLPAEPGK
ncbi:MAG: MarR family transcriptional regulator [Hyphomonas sp.]|uniref:MarR family winged helix-turn-helix transcriptional regulator n=1 Tax=Hyphomonas sp. TaxID=87 RepID=UPI001831FC89|nr:MarR family transcriptional regulator [Hyphomonas sp.]MBA3069220.1 MarR family transcriptional regulator [Hyphomonas sp.]MBU4061833.1 MarR family transcriptional regulator [Alphaproteobacteria bacterium]MBU4163335.1 MarR family transcriptional regulator [Alphaproteobacteria bacterium]